VRVFGLDFTSNPTQDNPHRLAEAEWDGERLRVERLRRLPTWEAFDAFLNSPGPWIAALDFPFGLPRPLIERLGWPLDWEACTAHAAAMGKGAFESALRADMAARPYGEKETKRAADRAAGAFSAMKLGRPPVAKMWFQGAHRLAETSVCVLPCRPTDATAICLEGFPGLLARSLIGRRPYKGESDVARSGREAILDSLEAGAVALTPEQRAECAIQPGGDVLDSVLCAWQAAQASLKGGFGLPAEADALEGWIVGS